MAQVIWYNSKANTLTVDVADAMGRTKTKQHTKRFIHASAFASNVEVDSHGVNKGPCFALVKLLSVLSSHYVDAITKGFSGPSCRRLERKHPTRIRYTPRQRVLRGNQRHRQVMESAWKGEGLSVSHVTDSYPPHIIIIYPFSAKARK